MEGVIDKINIGLISAVAGAVVYMFTTFASAADVERIEIRLLKSELRELRAEQRDYPDDERLQEYIEEILDELCTLAPQDRECS